MEISKKQLIESKGCSLKMKDLRKFVEKYKDINDETPVVVERVEDRYFEGFNFNGQKINGWDVIKVEGYHYHSAVEWNEKMRKEIKLRKKGKGEYDEKLKPEGAIYGEKELEQMKEEFYQPHCISTDKNIIYVYSHY